MTRPDFETRSGLRVDPVYQDRSGGGELPGEFPYTRGIDPAGYRDKLWVMGQYSGFGSAEETNARFRYLLEQGQTGFSIALDLPTQLGLDSDDPLARPEVGNVGVALDTVEDIHRLFDGIDLSQVAQIRTSANSIGPIIMALFIAFARERNVSPASFRVLLQNDSLKEYPARGTWIFPPEAALKLSVDAIEYCVRNLPEWNAIQFCGAHFREAGATAVQEVAFAFADAVAYLDNARDRGLDMAAVAEQFYLFVYVHTDVLEEVAKIRACRRLWANLVRERYGTGGAAAEKLKVFVWCGGSSLTTQQPLNNVVRVAIQALAASLAGVQTMATAAYDEGLSLPTEASAKLALRTQQVVAYESGVTNTVDPLGGSYFVEALTDDIEGQVRDELDRILDQGGAVRAIENGYFDTALAESAHRWQLALEDGSRVVVGVNRFLEEEPAVPLQALADRVPGELADSQARRLGEVRAARDQVRLKEALAAVTRAAERGENSVDVLVEAAVARATIGEMCEALAVVHGRHRSGSV